MKDFKLSFFITLLCLVLAGLWGTRNGMGLLPSVFLAFVLGVMEVSLSFDNAVVNASVLKTMDAKWQQLFLTLGILIAVFGMRVLFPVTVVWVATDFGFAEVAQMALEQPENYARQLAANHIAIAAFGGTFLLLIFFSFLCDEGKELHWLGAIERKLAELGKLDSFAVLLALVTVLGMHLWMPIGIVEKTVLLKAGIAGIILWIVVSSLDNFLSTDGIRNGLAGFFYLEMLDASFSFDGVIGAFAITRDVVIIMLGLAIGAMFVRSLTVHLVRKGTLDEYVFLEHGAHYAIGALAVIMLAGIVTQVSEVVTGVIGVGFIVLSLISSIRYKGEDLDEEQATS